MGFYIVKPEHRSTGYGLQMSAAGLAYLKECDSIGLDGVVAQQENYGKAGFEYAFRNVRYRGTGGGEIPARAGIVRSPSLSAEAILAYDLPFSPADRSRFLRAWMGQPEAVTLGIVREGRLDGYGVLRKCRSGRKIGPLFADDPALAESLFLALKSAAAPEESVFLDVPEINRAAVTLAERHDLKVVFETARMYKGAAPDMPMERIFGIASFEVG